MSVVVKKQMYLTEELNRRVKQLAQQTGRSESDIIRAALAEYMAKCDPELDPFDDFIGIGRSDGPTDLSVEHDRYLYGDLRRD